MDIFKVLNGTDAVFFATAIFGTVFFFLRTAMLIVGGFGSESADSSAAGHDAHDAVSDTPQDDSGTHSDSLEKTDAAFKLVSLNSITGMIMCSAGPGWRRTGSTSWGREYR